MHQTRLQVYIIDDDPSVCTAFSRLVRSGGMDARAFNSVEEFLASSFVSSDACVVADVQLPGKSGLELPGLLRDGGHALPVIFVSGLQLDTLRDAAKRTGASACFHKSVDGKALLDAIHWATRRAET